jgi:hypothetical protein
MKIIDAILNMAWYFTYRYWLIRQNSCRHRYPAAAIPDYMDHVSVRCCKCRKQLVKRKNSYNFKGVLATDYYRAAGYR